jgi:sugar lactone lactonase YvrE
MTRSPARVYSVVLLSLTLAACNGSKNLTPAGQTCPTGQTQCGTLCSSLATDPSNCGGCGNACATGLACVAGVCRPACAAPTIGCPAGTGLCINPQTDNANCGSCGNVCPPGQACSGGQCKPSCGAGTLLCPNGTCVNPQTDNANCGSCNNACPAGQACSGGTCQLTCVPGTIQCSDAPNTCVNPGTDNQNCGGCSTDGGGVICPGGELCSAGKCGETCSPGYTTCVPPPPADAGVDGGLPYCAQLGGDPNNCGACGVACGPGGACCPGANGSSCENILYDANNCGQCGHVCVGTSCQQGICVPTYLAILQFGATDIKVDSDSIYYLANLSAWQLPKDGGFPTIISFGTPFSPQGLVLDATDKNAYWSDFNSDWVWTTPIPPDGGHPFARPLLTTIFNPLQSPVPFGLAVDAYSVFYGGYGDAGLIESIPVNHGSPMQLTTGNFQPNGMAVDSAWVYWTDVLGGQVMRTDKIFGGAPHTLATGQSVPTGIAVDSSWVYWANAGNGTIMKVSLDGGAPIVVASGQSEPLRVAVDATHIFWTDFDAGMVLKAPLDGGAAEVIAYQQLGPDGIALDTTNVYWTDNASIGAVVTAPK